MLSAGRTLSGFAEMGQCGAGSGSFCGGYLERAVAVALASSTLQYLLRCHHSFQRLLQLQFYPQQNGGGDLFGDLELAGLVHLVRVRKPAGSMER